MYLGELEPVSNRADWRDTFELSDEDDVLVDLTGATIELTVRDARGCAVLTANETDGHITITGPGAFSLVFTDDEMAVVCAGRYDVGVRFTLASGETEQLLIGELAVLDGVI